MYKTILVGLDGSKHSEHAGDASIGLAKSFNGRLVACHVYAAEMHRTRFGEMELGLPQRYQKPERLEHLRDTHDDIISGGMKVISDAYIAPFATKASAVGVELEQKTPEGRNYVEFIKVLNDAGADLTVVGAVGQGQVQESSLGSFAERALLLARSDILIARGPWSMKGRPIIVGVDGSECSYYALRKAASIAAVTGTKVIAVAVYDPFFHTGVFNSISTALTNEQASHFNFAAQERLHDEIIDDGLRSLYDRRVQTGIEKAGVQGVVIEKAILTGKTFSQLAHYASVMNAGLVVVGRFGVHRESPSIIGSTAHALARLCPANLLVVGEQLESPEASTGNAKSPSTVQLKPPTEQAMDAPPPSSPFVDDGRPEAELVTLKKAKRLAPSFHEHIVRARIVGNQVETGTRFMVYDVVQTQPLGRVTVTERTRLEFI